MEENIYSKLPKLKIELNLASLVGIVLVSIFAFIIPIALIQNSKDTSTNVLANTPTTAQVAGISTSKEEQKITLPVINQSVLLEGQSGTLILIGLTLIAFSSVIILFIFIDWFRKRTLKH